MVALVLDSEAPVTFDCADIYTGVEELLGRVRTRVEAAGAGDRMRVHTKFVPDLDELARIDRDAVRVGLERSRERLRVDTLDLVQFHWWDAEVPGHVRVAGWLAELREEGLAENLGATNFTTSMLRAMLEDGVPLASHQVQYSLLDQRPAGAMAALCRAHGVRLLAYGSAAGGLLGDRWVAQPDPRGSEGNRSLVKYRLIVEEAGGWDALQRLLQELSARQGPLPLALLCAGWALQQPRVSSVLLGWTSAARAREARRALGVEPAGQGAWRELTDRLAGLDVSQFVRPLEGDVYELERSPGVHASILKTSLRSDAS